MVPVMFTLGEAKARISLGLSCFCDVVTTLRRSWHDGLAAHARAGGHLGASLPRVAAALCLPPAGSANLGLAPSPISPQNRPVGKWSGERMGATAGKVGPYVARSILDTFG